VAQLDDNAFSMLNVFNLAGMRGMLTYDIHLADQREREVMASTAGGGGGEGPVRQWGGEEWIYKMEENNTDKWKSILISKDETWFNADLICG
jgi:hypothetical protein